MLVLTRKLNEQIAIGEGITITVLRIKGNRVRIGISAPEEVHVVRGELPRYSDTSETREVKPADTSPPACRGLADPAPHDHPLRASRVAGLKPVLERVRPRALAAPGDRSVATPAPMRLAITAK